MAKNYPWPWFSSEMAARHSFYQARLPILSHFLKLDELAATTLNKDSSPLGERPQDYVACAFVSRAFRSVTSAVNLILSGYSDCHVALERTIWEMGITLFYINDLDAVGGAMGLLLSYYHNEVKIMKTEMDHMQAEGQPVLNLPENIKSTEEFSNILEEKARSKGFDPSVLINKYAKVKIATMCDHLRIRKAYDTSYAYMSAFAHGKFASVFETTKELTDKMGWILGPLTEEPEIAMTAQIYDVFNDYLILNGGASQVLKDPTLEKNVAEALEVLKKERLEP